MGIDRWLALAAGARTRSRRRRAELKLAELTRRYNLTIKQLRDQREALNAKDAHGRPGGHPGHHRPADLVRPPALRGDGRLLERLPARRRVLRRRRDDRAPRSTATSSASTRWAATPDMLVAANRHPALLIYLNQNQSTKDRVNENLARENLELYSVGVDGGYTEKDVKQAALLQTGRGVRDDEYVYRPEQHYVGPVKIMGFKPRRTAPPRVARRPPRRTSATWRCTRRRPATSRMNLATRFVSDTPPKSLVDRLAEVVPDQQGPDQAGADDAVQLVGVLGLGRPEGPPADGVPDRHVPHAGRPAGGAAGLPAEQRRTARRSREGLRQIRNKMDELGPLPRSACPRRTATRTSSSPGPRPGR